MKWVVSYCVFYSCHYQYPKYLSVNNLSSMLSTVPHYVHLNSKYSISFIRDFDTKNISFCDLR